VGLVALDSFYGMRRIPPMQQRNPYVGAAKCVTCHANIHDDYAQTGHPFKIQKVDGKPPSYPANTSPGVPAPPEGMTWNEISHVIGGYGWKARFMDRAGYILTGNKNRQYNLANSKLGVPAGWSGYDATKAPRKPYTCGSCHTTGWTETGPEGPNQDGLPGIHGTWQEAGVTCEACHGPGAAHVRNPTQASLSTAANCRSCHVRGDVERIDASGGLVKHHEQYEDLLASPHRNLGCLACHDPHKSTKYDRGGFLGQQATCLKCHESKDKQLLAAKSHGECISCHMPFAGKSAVAIEIAYDGGVLPKGDIRSHISRININPAWNMFTDDEKFVRIDEFGRTYLSLDQACLGCHVSKNKAWAAAHAARIHGDR
jgi:hypothetical protein